MGRPAAIAWGMLAALVALGALLDVPERVGMIVDGFGVRDATTVLVGTAVALVAAGLATLGVRRAWQGGNGAWLALPAAIIACGAIRGAMVTGIESWPFWTAATGSPFGIFFLPPSLLFGGLLVLVVHLVDRAVSQARG